MKLIAQLICDVLGNITNSEIINGVRNQSKRINPKISVALLIFNGIVKFITIWLKNHLKTGAKRGRPPKIRPQEESCL
jgi:hypothetical protein